MEEKIEQPTTEECGAQQELGDGSIGKFKDATSLLDAYNHLQAEFTRKSQELAEIKKERVDELANKNALTNENLDNTSENNSYAENIQNCEQDQDFDTILSQKLLKFAENNPEKLSELNDIKSELLTNKELLYMENGIDIANRLCMEKKKSTPAEIINDPVFIDKYILTNENITEAIIDKYIKSLAETKSPKIIQGDIGYVPITPNENLPKTLDDANKIFQKMLEK